MTLQEIHDALSDLPERLAEILKGGAEAMPTRQETAAPVPVTVSEPERKATEADARAEAPSLPSAPLPVILPAAEPIRPTSPVEATAAPLPVRPEVQSSPAPTAQAAPLPPSVSATAISEPMALPPRQDLSTPRDPAALPSVAPAALQAGSEQGSNGELMTLLTGIADDIKELVRIMKDRPSTSEAAPAKAASGKKWMTLYSTGDSGDENATVIPSVRIRTRN